LRGSGRRCRTATGPRGDKRSSARTDRGSLEQSFGYLTTVSDCQCAGCQDQQRAKREKQAHSKSPCWRTNGGRWLTIHARGDGPLCEWSRFIAAPTHIKIRAVSAASATSTVGTIPNVEPFILLCLVHGHGGTVVQSILVVEDEALIRLAAVDIVESAGFIAVEASNADAAIKILEARSDISVVFTDVDMPGSMDGLKLAHYIRDRWPPIILIVASGKAIVAESKLPSGARFFNKPYEQHAIENAIREMLSEK